MTSTAPGYKVVKSVRPIGVRNDVVRHKDNVGSPALLACVVVTLKHLLTKLTPFSFGKVSAMATVPAVVVRATQLCNMLWRFRFPGKCASNFQAMVQGEYLARTSYTDLLLGAFRPGLPFVMWNLSRLKPSGICWHGSASLHLPKVLFGLLGHRNALVWRRLTLLERTGVCHRGPNYQRIAGTSPAKPMHIAVAVTVVRAVTPWYRTGSHVGFPQLNHLYVGAS